MFSNIFYLNIESYIVVKGHSNRIIWHFIKVDCMILKFRREEIELLLRGGQNEEHNRRDCIIYIVEITISHIQIRTQSN